MRSYTTAHGRNSVDIQVKKARKMGEMVEG
jgi:hypothetical protein